MIEPFEKQAVLAVEAVRRGDVSAVTLTARFLARVEGGNAAFGALRDVLAEKAMASASGIDRRRHAGAAALPLGGLPIVIKENCDTEGARCSAGLPFRAKRVATDDAPVVSRLKQAGAVVIGVAVSDPGAFGVRTAEVTHPADPELTVGGSSGGSAAALAAGFCLGAIGTDTGGSIRIPAACCGIVGLKPTFAALPMRGIHPLIPSLDHVGPMGLTVDDVSLLWSALSGETSGEPNRPVRVVGIDPAWIDDADPAIADAFHNLLDRLNGLDIEIRRIRLPDPEDVLSMHGRIFFTEGAAYHHAHFPEDIRHYPDMAQRWFETAMRDPVSQYVDACVRRVEMRTHVDRLLEEVDVILTPTLSVLHARRDAAELAVSGKPSDFTLALVRLTSLFNHTGHPALSMPLAHPGPLPPPALQIVGAHGRERQILTFGREIETGIRR